MKNAIIIGYGRFGQLLVEILSSEFRIGILEKEKSLVRKARKQNIDVFELKDIVNFDYIFLAVPINATEGIIKVISNYISKRQLIMDVCSVKSYPAKLMVKHLKGCQLMATHPMFGPDSAKDGLHGLKIVLCPLNISGSEFKFWQEYWTKQGLQVIITTPEKHDKEAIYSQAFTYTLAKIVNLMKIPDIDITTRSFEAIKNIADYSANDSIQLYHDMLYYNPYFKTMKKDLFKVIKQTKNILDGIEKEKVKIE